MVVILINRCFCVLFLILSAFALVNGIIINYLKGRAKQNNTFRVWIENLAYSTGLKQQLPERMGRNLPFYKNISKMMTVDQRCLAGEPLGAAVFLSSPYANMFSFNEKPPKPQQQPDAFEFYGIFPAVLKKAIRVCCHDNSSIKFAKLLAEQKASEPIDFDFYFPFYGHGMDDTTHQDNPFIPIIQAPSVALLVHNDNSKDGKTRLIATTIFEAWPILFFILLLASSSGIIMWFLDHSKNDEAFSKPFIEGAWEGFWWAFITMTTVGYGDRTPKSYLARFFCVLWIIFGVIIVSIFSGLITASLSASTRTQFIVHGAKIGAVSGSQEFKLGISLNADMRHYKSSFVPFGKVLEREIDGVLVDNYVANHFGPTIVKMSLRVDRMIKHAITYGVMFGNNSKYLEGCVRKFILDNPQDVFEMVRESLPSVKNPADKENLQLKEAEKLFYRDQTMTNMLVYGCYFIVAVLVVGISFQVVYNRNRKGKSSAKYSHHVVNDKFQWRCNSFQSVDGSLKDVIEQYNSFQDGWMNRMKSVDHK